MSLINNIFESEEIWKVIPNFERYLVSSFGNVKSLPWIHPSGAKHKGKNLKKTLNQKGYPHVKLYNQTRNRSVPIHRLVAEVFLPNLDNLPQVDHKDGNKQNNHILNLEWVTNEENQHRAVKLGLHPQLYGKSNPFFKGTIFVFNKNNQFICEINGAADAESKGFQSKNVYACLNGKKKTHRGMIFKRL